MYTQDFYITEPVGNNTFSYDIRKNKRLFVPKLKKIKSFDEIELLSNPSPLRGASFTKGSHKTKHDIKMQPPAFCKGRNLGRI